MSAWKPLPDYGPRRRCEWGGGWRCQETAVWWRENSRRGLAVCEAHRRWKDSVEAEPIKGRPA